jgi:hypothetical protein
MITLVHIQTRVENAVKTFLESGGKSARDLELSNAKISGLASFV